MLIAHTEILGQSLCNPQQRGYSQDDFNRAFLTGVLILETFYRLRTVWNLLDIVNCQTGGRSTLGLNARSLPLFSDSCAVARRGFVGAHRANGNASSIRMLLREQRLTQLTRT